MDNDIVINHIKESGSRFELMNNLVKYMKEYNYLANFIETCKSKTSNIYIWEYDLVLTDNKKLYCVNDSIKKLLNK